MKIAVLGTGAVGQTLSAKLAELGHDVIMGTRNIADALARKTPDAYGRPSLGAWHKEHPGVRIGTYNEAAAHGEFIINATNGAGTMQALELAGRDNLRNKALLDISNPLDFSKGMPPSLLICNTDSLGEQIQRAYPDTRVVKGLNTMTAAVMVHPALLPEDHHVFLNGNDAGAKKTVSGILKSFGWKEKNIIDMGDISTARGTEQLLPIWVRLWGALKTPMFNFKIVMANTPSA